MVFGKKLKLLLDIRQRNVKELANFLHVSTTTIYRWIREESRPDYEEFWYISLFLKVNIVNLYGLDSNFETLLTAYERGFIKITDMEL